MSFWRCSNDPSVPNPSMGPQQDHTSLAPTFSASAVYKQLTRRLDLFRARLDEVFTTAAGAEGVLELSDLLPLVNESLEIADMFGSGEARKAAQKMHDKNEIMLAEGTVYKV